MIKGTISKELLKRFRETTREAELLEDEIKLFFQQKKKEAEAEFRTRFEDRLGDLELEKSNIWDAIYEELNIDPSGHYSLDRRTGRVIEEIDDEVDDMPHPLHLLKHILEEGMKGNAKVQVSGIEKGKTSAKIKDFQEFIARKRNDGIFH